MCYNNIEYPSVRGPVKRHIFVVRSTLWKCYSGIL